MNKRKDNSNGITLIALVLTILIMVTLSAISLNAIVGENGIIKEAKVSKEVERNANIQEIVELAWKAKLIKIDDSIDIENLAPYDLAKIIEELNKELKDYGKVIGISSFVEENVKKYYILFEDNNGNTQEYRIDITGKITETYAVSNTLKEDRIKEYEESGGVSENTIEKILAEKEFSSVWVSFYRDSGIMTYASSKNIKLDGQTPEIQWDLSDGINYYTVPWMELKEITNNDGVVIKTIDTTTYINNIKKVVILDKINPKNTNYLFYYFTNCETFEGLEKIDYSYSKKIGNSQFSHCYKLIEAIVPETVEKIDQGAFLGCTDLTNVKINGNVKVIESCAFSMCQKLISINLPFSLEQIKAKAFYFAGLTEVIIPENVNYIGIDCFIYSKLKTIYYNAINAKNGGNFEGSSINGYPFPMSVNKIIIGNKVEYIDSVSFIGTQITTLDIPNSVKEIGEYAFCACALLTNVNLGDGVEKLGSCSFFSNSGLKKVEGGNSLKEIAEYSFYKCTSLESINLGTKLTSLESSLFYQCSSLKSIVIPNTVIDIKGYVFYECLALEDVYFSNSLQNIGNMSFYNSNIKTLNLPDSVEVIGIGAFFECQSLTEVTIPINVKNMGKYSFACCDNLSKINYNARLASDTDLCDASSGVMPAFYFSGINCSSEETVINIGSSVLLLPSYLFWAYDVKNVNIEPGLLGIGAQVFDECNRLEEITLPSTVYTISKFAFWDCTNLKKIIVKKAENSISNAPWSNSTTVQVIWDPS